MSIYLKNHIDDVYEYVFKNFKQTVNQLVIKILNRTGTPINRF